MEPHLIGPQDGQATQREEADQDYKDHQTNPKTSAQSVKTSRTRWDIGGAAHEASLRVFKPAPTRTRNRRAAADTASHWEKPDRRDVRRHSHPVRRRRTARRWGPRKSARSVPGTRPRPPSTKPVGPRRCRVVRRARRATPYTPRSPARDRRRYRRP